MATSGKRGLLAVEDVKQHDPTVGSAADAFNPATAGSVQTFSRTSQSGGTVSRTKVSAANIPIIDEVVVAGARSPFNDIVASQHNVEAALARIRTSVPHYLNLEAYGAQAGVGVSSAIAAKNTQVWNQLVSDISATGRGGGIFIPPGQFEFGGSAPILEINSKSQINIVGAGAGSILKANAANADVLLRLTDCSGVQFADLQLDKSANTAGSITCQVRASAARIDNIGFYSVIFTKGATGLKLDNASKHGNTFWVRDCTFDTFLTRGVEFIDWARGRITGCTFNGASPGKMILGSCAAAADQLLDCEISNNKSFSAQKSDIQLSTIGATYSASLHSGIDIIANNISVGDIMADSIDQPNISQNRCKTGGIVYAFSAAANLNTPRFVGNHLENSIGHGIEFSALANAVFGLEISGGRITTAQGAGIFVGSPGATSFNRYMRIYGVNILNCSQQGNGNHSGIRLEGAAGNGTTDSVVTGNVIISTGAPKHQYGVQEVAGGSIRNNIYGNVIKGWVTAALLGPAGGSVTGANIDGGA